MAKTSLRLLTFSDHQGKQHKIVHSNTLTIKVIIFIFKQHHDVVELWPKLSLAENHAVCLIFNMYVLSLCKGLTLLIQIQNPRWLRAFPKQTLAHAYSM